MKLCGDDYDELLNVNNLSTNENKADTGFHPAFQPRQITSKTFIKLHFGFVALLITYRYLLDDVVGAADDGGQDGNAVSRESH